MKTLILGDVSPNHKSAELFDEAKTAELFGDTIGLFEKSDFTFINLECAITDSDHAISKCGPNLKAPKNTAKVLKELGVSLAGLSNNHIFDFGIPGYRDTVKALEAEGIDYTGFGENYEDSRKNYVFEKDGEKICFITVCEHEYSYALENRLGSRPFDCYDTLDDVRKAKKKCDRVIVIYHGGKEHSRYPSPRLVKLYHALADAGADVVVGQHSHCICCYENYNGSHLMFGQGNSHFADIYNDKYPDWPTAVYLMYDTKTNEMEFYPIHTDDKSVSLAKGEVKTEIEERMKTLNAQMKDGSWIDGWYEFCENNRESYMTRAANCFAEGAEWRKVRAFGHYLDCEAHLDVWMELNRTENHFNELEPGSKTPPIPHGGEHLSDKNK